MATTTPNFGWDVPQSTDLVKDGATAIAALGNDIDAALVDLKGGTTGQILSKNSNTDLDYTWINNDQGDITAVTAGTGISGGGTTGAVTITNSMATEITAKGDIIVGTGNATFDNLAVGTNGQVLQADSTTATGLKWATAGATYNLQSQDFTSSGTWTKPSGVTKVQVLLVGGGRGGNGSKNAGCCGAGGAGGQVKLEIVDVSAVSTVSVTIGAGGAGGTDNQNVAPGSAGSNSTFGALLTATGASTAGADTNGGALRAVIGGGGAGNLDKSCAHGGFINTFATNTFYPINSTDNGSLNCGDRRGTSNNSATEAHGRAGCGGSGYLGFGGGGGAGYSFTSGVSNGLYVGTGADGGGNGNYGGAGAAGTANTGGGGGGSGADSATARAGGNGGSGFCRVIWVA